MRWSFRVFGNAILGLGTRLVHDWYAIKVLIINAETRFRDFSLFWKGSVKKNEKKIYIGEYRKAVKSCNRVPKIFGRFLSLGFLADFWRGVFVGFLAVLGRKWPKIGCFDNGCIGNYLVID